MQSPQTPKVTGLDRAAKGQELCGSSEAGGRWAPQGKAIGDSFPKVWASLVARLVKSSLQCRRPWFNSWVGKIPWRSDRLPTPVFLGYFCGSSSKESTCNVGKRFDIWVGKIPWRRKRLPTPIFWPGEFHGLYSPWGCKESDTTEWLSQLLLLVETFTASV